MWSVASSDSTISLLERSLKGNSRPHAYLLAGPPRIGKSTLAVNTAQAVNCSQPSASGGCGSCSACTRIAQSKHPDVSTLQVPRDKTEIGIDQIQEVQKSASLKPYEGLCRVFIINGADRLSAEAANRLLKSLEEPPSQVLFILTANRVEDVIPTIVSRCMVIEIERAPPSKIASLLMNSYGQPQEKAERLARICRGAVGWAVECCANEKLLTRREETLKDLSDLEDASWDERFSYAAELAGGFSRNREEVKETLSLWQSWWRDVLMLQCADADDVCNVDMKERLIESALRFTTEQAISTMRAIDDAWLRLELNASPRLALEVLMLSLPQPPQQGRYGRAAQSTSP
jgi:DNA polymerase-3 subunit delta'